MDHVRNSSFEPSPFAFNQRQPAGDGVTALVLASAPPDGHWDGGGTLRPSPSTRHPGSTLSPTYANCRKCNEAYAQFLPVTQLADINQILAEEIRTNSVCPHPVGNLVLFRITETEDRKIGCLRFLLSLCRVHLAKSISCITFFYSCIYVQVKSLRDLSISIYSLIILL